MADEDRNRPELSAQMDDLEGGIDPRDDTLAFEPVQPRTPKRKVPLSLLILLLMLIAGAGAGVGGWYGWGEEYFFGKDGEMIIVRAEEGPIKVRPASPGGLEVPNRDKLVYERLEKKVPAVKTETLLPRPELPLPPPTKIPAAVVPPSIETAAGTPAHPTDPATLPPINSSPSKAVTQKPLPRIIEASKAPPPPPPPPPPRAKTNPPPAPLAAPKVAAADPKSASKSAAGGFHIQIAAVRTEKAARDEWGRLKKKYQPLLGKLSLTVVKADLGSRGVFYRLRAGPISNRGTGWETCGELTKQKVGCLVVSPGR
ncbi:MAG: SPOR domain-containing protein [Proteobacteria bacterium]|nr:SPOR domain-containing protein [Pseudomonadota bacterium]